MTFGLHIGWHWHHLHYFAFVTWYCHRLHCPVILIHIVFTIWHWYSWYRFLILLYWVTHYLSLTMINEIKQVGIIRETGSRGNQGSVLERATPCRFGCHTWSCVLVIYPRTCYYMLHDTWIQWTISSCYQDPLTHQLIWYAVVLWDGARDGCIS